MASNGHVSTRNAGTKASPVDVSPTRPRRPGKTHHQGIGSSPLNSAGNGFSTCRILSIALLHTAGHHRHVLGVGLQFDDDFALCSSSVWNMLVRVGPPRTRGNLAESSGAAGGSAALQMTAQEVYRGVCRTLLVPVPVSLGVNLHGPILAVFDR